MANKNGSVNNKLQPSVYRFNSGSLVLKNLHHLIKKLTQRFRDMELVMEVLNLINKTRKAG